MKQEPCRHCINNILNGLIEQTKFIKNAIYNGEESWESIDKYLLKMLYINVDDLLEMVENLKKFNRNK